MSQWLLLCCIEPTFLGSFYILSKALHTTTTKVQCLLSEEDVLLARVTADSPIWRMTHCD